MRERERGGGAVSTPPEICVISVRYKLSSNIYEVDIAGCVERCISKKRETGVGRYGWRKKERKRKDVSFTMRFVQEQVSFAQIPKKLHSNGSHI